MQITGAETTHPNKTQTNGLPVEPGESKKKGGNKAGNTRARPRINQSNMEILSQFNLLLFCAAMDYLLKCSNYKCFC